MASDNAARLARIAEKLGVETTPEAEARRVQRARRLQDAWLQALRPGGSPRAVRAEADARARSST